MQAIQSNLLYIASGKIGCTFASVAARFLLQGKEVGWQIVRINQMSDKMPPIEKATVSLVFPQSWNQYKVEKWCLKNGMREVIVHKGTLTRRIKRFLSGVRLKGLRVDIAEGLESWVMYFGKDAHCPTRRTPYPMITFRAKQPTNPYHKVGFNGKVLHIAQMCLEVSKDKLDRLWKTSHQNTERVIGKKPDENHAAKTTYRRNIIVEFFKKMFV